MLTVEEYCKIRTAIGTRWAFGRSPGGSIIRGGRFGRCLSRASPTSVHARQDRLVPRLGPYKAVIERIPAEGEQTPRKQRHMATKLYCRSLDEHGYAGSYDQVRRYVGKRVRDRYETFIPLTHPPGWRLEVRASAH